MNHHSPRFLAAGARSTKNALWSNRAPCEQVKVLRYGLENLSDVTEALGEFTVSHALRFRAKVLCEIAPTSQPQRRRSVSGFSLSQARISEQQYCCAGHFRHTIFEGRRWSTIRAVLRTVVVPQLLEFQWYCSASETWTELRFSTREQVQNRLHEAVKFIFIWYSDGWICFSFVCPSSVRLSEHQLAVWQHHGLQSLCS